MATLGLKMTPQKPAVSGLLPTRLRALRPPSPRVASLYLLVLLWCLGEPPAAALGSERQKFDVVIRGGLVVDGSGQAAEIADVGIVDSRIAAIGPLTGAAADQFVDAAGHIVCPGFIDLHSHADRGIREFRAAENYIRQGATTLVCGNCGSSPTDVARFFDELEESGTGPNIVLLIGHGSVRQAVMGRLNAPPDARQLAEMKRLVRRAMQAGAVGMSTSLRYGPGTYATTDEIVELARETAPFGGFYATHMRDEGTRILEALTEALMIGRRAGVPVHVSHHKISSASVFGLTRLTLARIDEARQSGQDVTLDQYPYGAGSGGMGLYVPQGSLSGGLDAYRRRIADPQQRVAIRRSVEELLIRKIFLADQSPDDPKDTAQALARIQVARASHDPQLEGKRLPDILQDRQQEVTLGNGAELLIELVSHGVRGINHTLDAASGGDVDRVMQHPQTCIASDGGVLEFGSGNPHPRSYGCYPRVLGRYVRGRNLLSLEQAIHKMTALPARRLGYRDRGLLKEKFWADLVVFDPRRVIDNATFVEPHQHSVGIRDVMVRGSFVLRDSKMTGNLPGRPIRHQVPQ